MRVLSLPATVGIGFAAYRLARVIAHDKIGQPLRDSAYKASAKYGKPGRWLNALMTCPYCISVYASAGGVIWAATLIGPWPGIAEVLLAIPTAAGVAAILAGADMALTMYTEHHPL